MVDDNDDVNYQISKLMIYLYYSTFVMGLQSAMYGMLTTKYVGQMQRSDMPLTIF